MVITEVLLRQIEPVLRAQDNTKEDLAAQGLRLVLVMVVLEVDRKIALLEAWDKDKEDRPRLK